jgi:hypothetical protein
VDVRETRGSGEMGKEYREQQVPPTLSQDQKPVRNCDITIEKRERE